MSKGGIRIGNYRITPLGLTVIMIIVVAILLAIVYFVYNPFAPASDAAKTSGGNVVKVATVPSDVPETPAIVAATPTPVPTPTPEPTPRTATIRALGEIIIENELLKSCYNKTDSTFDFSEIFSMIEKSMGSADYTVADVEGAMGDVGNYSGTSAMMNTPSSLITALKNSGVDMLTLANDHTLDTNWEGLQNTIINCVGADMDYIGANNSSAEKSAAFVKDINGIQVGFLNYTESVGAMEKTADKAALQYGIDWISSSNLAGDIAALKEKQADVIVAFVSWGNVMSQSITNSQKSIASAMAGMGVDVIIGYNPMMIQPANKLEVTLPDGTAHSTLIMCSLGGFVSNQRAKYTDSSVIFEFTIQEKDDGTFEIVNPLYVPTYVWRTEREDGAYQFRVLACGEYLDTQPEGMSYTDATRLKEVWAEAQNTMALGTNIATVSAS